MAPLAAHDYVPRTNDYMYHLGNIQLARESLLHGSIWLRVVAQNLFYPLFQFYAPTAYTIGGIFAITFTHNPLDPFKLAIGLSVILGAWYCYKLYVYLFKNEIAAVLGGALYLFSPYLLININVRGDFTEAITQGLLPIAIYYAFRLFYVQEFNYQKVYFFLVSVFSFYIIATAHIITFVYSSLYLFLLLFILGIQQKRIRSFFRVALAFACAIILALWYLFPLVTYEHSLIMGAVGIFGPWNSAWISPISTIIAPKGISQSYWFSTTNFPLYPGLGLPILITFLYWLYRFYFDKKPIENIHAGLLKGLFWVCVVIFIMFWSPVNFWPFLPRQFYVLQYTYRLLTDIMWTGGILFVAMLIDLFKGEWDRRYFILGIFCIALSGAGWMYSNYADNSHPNAGPVPLEYNGKLSPTMVAGDYTLDPGQVKIAPEFSNTAKLKLLMPAKKNQCKLEGLTSICKFSVQTAEQAVQLPILYYPGLLEIKVNGRKVLYYPSKGNDFLGEILITVPLNKGDYTVVSRFEGLSLVNLISRIGWILYFFVIGFFISRRYILRTK